MSLTIDTKKLHAVLDADVLLYRCGFAADAQARGDFKDEFPDASPEEIEDHLASFDYEHYAKHNAKSVILDTQEIFSRDCVLYLSGHGNFREQMATILPYKGNRDKTHRPKYYKELKQYFVEHWDAIVVDGREADDALSCELWKAPDETVLVTIDKDLDNTPGWHYNWVKKELYYVSSEAADYNFWKQVLTGDTTDNIPGIKGIGPKKAEKILEGRENDWYEMAAAVTVAYETAFGDNAPQYLYENASLIWMQREEGINFDDRPYEMPAHTEDEHTTEHTDDRQA